MLQLSSVGDAESAGRGAEACFDVPLEGRLLGGEVLDRLEHVGGSGGHWGGGLLLRLDGEQGFVEAPVADRSVVAAPSSSMRWRTRCRPARSTPSLVSVVSSAATAFCMQGAPHEAPSKEHMVMYDAKRKPPVRAPPVSRRRWVVAPPRPQHPLTARSLPHTFEEVDDILALPPGSRDGLAIESAFCAVDDTVM